MIRFGSDSPARKNTAMADRPRFFLAAALLAALAPAMAAAADQPIASAPIPPLMPPAPYVVPSHPATATTLPKISDAAPAAAKKPHGGQPRGVPGTQHFGPRGITLGRSRRTARSRAAIRRRGSVTAAAAALLRRRRAVAPLGGGTAAARRLRLLPPPVAARPRALVGSGPADLRPLGDLPGAKVFSTLKVGRAASEATIGGEPR